MMTDDAARLLEELKRRSWTLATAESLTGGGIGQHLTAVSGSSAVYLGGVISYTNAVKARVLGVPQEILDTEGAVSPETADAMVRGVCNMLGAHVGIVVTGIAGPNSDETGKPVGLVYIGVSVCGHVSVTEHHFSGDREAVRSSTIHQAIKQAIEMLNA